MGSSFLLGGFPFLPILIGIFAFAQIMTDANPWLFLTRPISGTLIGLSVASVILALWQHHRAQARMAQPPEQEMGF
jgi:putative tricarboxylic transport membrane protein